MEVKGLMDCKNLGEELVQTCSTNDRVSEISSFQTNSIKARIKDASLFYIYYCYC